MNSHVNADIWPSGRTTRSWPGEVNESGLFTLWARLKGCGSEATFAQRPRVFRANRGKADLVHLGDGSRWQPDPLASDRWISAHISKLLAASTKSDRASPRRHRICLTARADVAPHLAAGAELRSATGGTSALSHFLHISLTWQKEADKWNTRALNLKKMHLGIILKGTTPSEASVDLPPRLWSFFKVSCMKCLKTRCEIQTTHSALIKNKVRLSNRRVSL